MITLDFDPDTHIYKTGGVVLPSVTKVIAPMVDFRFVDPQVLQLAAEFGTAVHRLCELYDLDTLDMDSVSPALLPYLTAWKRFLAEMDVTVLEVEKRYYHKLLGYAGQLDRVLLVNGRKVLADIKTVSRLGPVVGIQLAGYQKLLVGNTDHVYTDRAAVQLCADGTYRYQVYSDPTDWPVFVSLLSIHNWRKKYVIQGDLNHEHHTTGNDRNPDQSHHHRQPAFAGAN